MCKRGDVYYVDFGMNIDTRKQSGIRPAVIVSNNKANAHSPVITVGKSLICCLSACTHLQWVPGMT